MEKKEVRLRKIPLQTFLDTLIEIYNSGVDYIDIVGAPDEIQDTIGIMFSDEYLSKAERDDFYEKDIAEDVPPPPPPPKETNNESKINIKLSDEDLNQLL